MENKCGSGLEAFLPMETWDKRDETVLLLIDYTEGGEHPLEDADIAITIGHNNDHNTVGDGDLEGDGWKFAGWCWSHDQYVHGKGRPIGWMPIPHHLAATGRYEPVAPAPASHPAPEFGFLDSVLSGFAKMRSQNNG